MRILLGDLIFREAVDEIKYGVYIIWDQCTLIPVYIGISGAYPRTRIMGHLGRSWRGEISQLGETILRSIPFCFDWIVEIIQPELNKNSTHAGLLQELKFSERDLINKYGSWLNKQPSNYPSKKRPWWYQNIIPDGISTMVLDAWGADEPLDKKGNAREK